MVIIFWPEKRCSKNSLNWFYGLEQLRSAWSERTALSHSMVPVCSKTKVNRNIFGAESAELKFEEVGFAKIEQMIMTIKKKS